MRSGYFPSGRENAGSRRLSGSRNGLWPEYVTKVSRNGRSLSATISPLLSFSTAWRMKEPSLSLAGLPITSSIFHDERSSSVSYPIERAMASWFHVIGLSQVRMAQRASRSAFMAFISEG